MAKKFNYPDRASFSRMTNVDAQAIVQYVAELEFPKIYEMSLQFALFKVCYVLGRCDYSELIYVCVFLDVWYPNYIWSPSCYQGIFYDGKCK